MSKNVVLFIDGTWNQAADQLKHEDTNVYKLCRAARRQPDQECKYLTGIGTDRWLGKLPHIPRNIIGGLFGLGMSERVKDAYRFLSRNYAYGDHVYLFGFSRGAFAARSVAGFVDAIGLLLAAKADDPNLVEQAYALYENDEDPAHSALREFLRKLGLPDQPSVENRTVLPIYFIGVWDTVAALGLPGRMARFSAPFTEHHATKLPSNVSYARHALAIHELRWDFRPLLWEDSMDNATPPRLQQMWFPGAHADVGGGYPETDWSDIALDWMAAEASRLGLRLRDLPRPADSILPDVITHNSIRRMFALATPTLRSELSNPLTVDSATRSTFAMHPVVTQRLLRPELTAYSFFRAAVNAGLRSADVATIRLAGSCGLGLLDATRTAALTTFWSEPEWSADCLAYTVLNYLHDVAVPTEKETAAFVRALYAQVVFRLITPEHLATAINDLVKSTLHTFAGSLDVPRPEGLEQRLKVIAEHVARITTHFRDDLVPRIQQFVAAVENARTDLSTGLLVEEFKSGTHTSFAVPSPLRLSSPALGIQPK